jgi:hypothetical protein
MKKVRIAPLELGLQIYTFFMVNKIIFQKKVQVIFPVENIGFYSGKNWLFLP